MKRRSLLGMIAIPLLALAPKVAEALGERCVDGRTFDDVCRTDESQEARLRQLESEVALLKRCFRTEIIGRPQTGEKVCEIGWER